jgi:hypothetical protein
MVVDKSGSCGISRCRGGEAGGGSIAYGSNPLHSHRALALLSSPEAVTTGIMPGRGSPRTSAVGESMPYSRWLSVRWRFRAGPAPVAKVAAGDDGHHARPRKSEPASLAHDGRRDRVASFAGHGRFEPYARGWYGPARRW